MYGKEGIYIGEDDGCVPVDAVKCNNYERVLSLMLKALFFKS